MSDKTIINATKSQLDQWISEYKPDALKMNEIAFENNSTIRTCVKIITDATSTVPLSIFQKEGKDKIKLYDDPRHFLLNRRPNGMMNSQVWRALMAARAFFEGDSFSYIERDGYNGMPKSFKILDNIDRVYYGEKNGELIYLQLDKNRKNVIKEIPAVDVIHWMGISSNGIFGMTTEEALKMQLKTSQAGYETLNNHYVNGARSPLLLKHTVALNAKEAKNAENRIKEFASKLLGIKRQNSIVDVPINMEPINWDTNIGESQILETMKFNLKDIAALFGIAPFMIGDSEQSKFNSIEYLTRYFNTFTLRPLFNKWRKELEDKLLTDNEWQKGMSIEFITNALIEMDSTVKAETYQKYIQNGVITPGFVASLEGFPSPDTSEEYFVSNNHMSYNEKIEANKLANDKSRVEIEKMMLEIEMLKKKK